MSAIGYHVIMKLADGSVIAKSVAERRALARIVLGQGEGRGLVAFRAPDTHVHAELAADRAGAGQFAREVEIALSSKLRLRAPFQTAYMKPIESQSHAYSTFRYILSQDRHHGVESDPYHEASNLPDLLGLRVLGGSTDEMVRRVLPRIRREELVALCGVADLGCAARELRHLGDAAAAAVAIADVAAKSRSAIAARRAAAHLARAELTAHEIAELLGVDASTVRRLLVLPAPARLMLAVDLQLRLRTARAVQSLGFLPEPTQRRPA